MEWTRDRIMQDYSSLFYYKSATRPLRQVGETILSLRVVELNGESDGRLGNRRKGTKAHDGKW